MVRALTRPKRRSTMSRRRLAGYKEPLDLLFTVPKFEYDDVVGAEGLQPRTVPRL